MPSSGFQCPPGTVRLLNEDGVRESKHTVERIPIPSSDPNDPLNWSMGRKLLNFIPILAISTIIFTQYSIYLVFWQLYVIDLHTTFNGLASASAVGLAGTALGCVFFIPIAIKFGRRSIYIASLTVMSGCAIWQAKMTTIGELFAIQMLTGLAGATNETIVQMTIADLFFVHQRGTANGLYMVMVMIGSFLSPVAAGYIGNDGNWRLAYWILVGFDLFALVWFIVAFEESKYLPTLSGRLRSTSDEEFASTEAGERGKADVDAKQPDLLRVQTAGTNRIDSSIPLLSYRQRLRLVTVTPENFWQTFRRPFPALIYFPVVLYTSLQYSFGLAWISVISTTITIVYPYPPYNFSPAGIGLMSLGCFVGCILGSVYGGLLSDWSVVRLARKNNGYYEPEMRLHLLHLPLLSQAAGILMFGICTARGMHWSYGAVGGGLFGFGLGSISDIALTLTIDSYRAITGEAFVAIAFIRNISSIAFYFAITPWIERQGIQNMYIVITILSLVIAGLYIPLIIWGKKIRSKTAARYLSYADAKGEIRA